MPVPPSWRFALWIARLVAGPACAGQVALRVGDRLVAGCLPLPGGFPTVALRSCDTTSPSCLLRLPKPKCFSWLSSSHGMVVIGEARCAHLLTGTPLPDGCAIPCRFTLPLCFVNEISVQQISCLSRPSQPRGYGPSLVTTLYPWNRPSPFIIGEVWVTTSYHTSMISVQVVSLWG